MSVLFVQVSQAGFLDKKEIHFVIYLFGKSRQLYVFGGG